MDQDCACLLCGNAVYKDRQRDANEHYRACKDETSIIPWFLLCLTCIIVYAIAENWNNPRLSSVPRIGVHWDPLLNPNGILAAPLEDDLGIDVSDQIFQENFVLYRTSATASSDNSHLRLWGFAIHDYCWSLLCEVNNLMGEQDHIQALFDLCVSQPNVNITVDWFHNYGGLLRRRYLNTIRRPGKVCPPGRGYDFEDTRRFNFRGDGPIGDCMLRNFKPKGHFPRRDLKWEFRDLAQHRIPYTSLPEDVWFVVGQHYQKSFYTDLPNDGICPTPLRPGPRLRMLSHDTRDPFELLPTELCIQILMLMPPDDIKNLRLASKVFATFELPEQYWHSRFLNGNEFSYLHLWASGWPDPSTWAEKYANTMKYHRCLKISVQEIPDGCEALHDRKRVWNLAEYLSRLVELRLSIKRCRPQVRRIETGAGQSYREGENWLNAHSDVVPFNREPRGGCRLLFEDAISIPNGEAITEVSVSLVSLHGGKCLSGLTFSSKYHVGYVIHDDRRTRESATWSGSTRVPGAVRGFHLALDSHSLRGVRVYCVPGGLSDWIGDHEGFAEQAIIYPAGSLQKVELGLNALHAVSLSIFNQDVQDFNASLSSESDSISGTWPPGIWFPQIPDSSLRVVGLEDRTLWNTHWDSFHSCLFGGVDGQKLPEVTHIDLRSAKRYRSGDTWVEEPGEISYIQFSYTFPVEGREVYGVEESDLIRQQISFTFPVEDRTTYVVKGPDPYTLGSEAYLDEMYKKESLGSGEAPRYGEHRITLDRHFGERLVAVDAIYRLDSEKVLHGLIMHTSCNRAVEVPDGISGIGSEAGYEIVHIRPEGGIIVGVCGQISQSENLRNFGLLIAPKKCCTE
ncbi:unnamed protein product [Clonostachys rosea]|uniref:DUF7600 domain-containing protein n=1 Tax=Bionectria ochroleuca TaxID=29856 RepID=A0ABY6V027_BIOOC|nr:unnamed protein product [Clonostachys rosea]